MLLDVSEPEAWDRAVDAAQAAGDLAALVNCAARTDVRDLFEIEPEEWDDVLATNLRGPFLGIRVVGPVLRRRGAGRIVNLASDSASAAVASRVLTMRPRRRGCSRSPGVQRRRLAAFGVTVNAVAPGTIDGETVRELAGDRAEALAARSPPAASAERTRSPRS